MKKTAFVLVLPDGTRHFIQTDSGEEAKTRAEKMLAYLGRGGHDCQGAILVKEIVLHQWPLEALKQELPKLQDIFCEGAD